jgi:hypothetical protein
MDIRNTGKRGREPSFSVSDNSNIFSSSSSSSSSSNNSPKKRKDDNQVNLPKILIRYIGDEKRDPYFKEGQPEGQEIANLIENIRNQLNPQSKTTTTTTLSSSKKSKSEVKVQYGTFSLSGRGVSTTANTYLSAPGSSSNPNTYGVGTNITGFMEAENIELRGQAFATGLNKRLIIVLTPLIPTKTDLPFYWCNITGLHTKIDSCQNMVKVAQLGMLMGEQSNTEEWNFITNDCIKLPAICIHSTGGGVDLPLYLRQVKEMIKSMLSVKEPIKLMDLENPYGCPIDYQIGVPKPCPDIAEPKEENNKNSIITGFETEDEEDKTDLFFGRGKKPKRKTLKRKSTSKKFKTRRSKPRY